MNPIIIENLESAISLLSNRVVAGRVLKTDIKNIQKIDPRIKYQSWIYSVVSLKNGEDKLVSPGELLDSFIEIRKERSAHCKLIGIDYSKNQFLFESSSSDEEHLVEITPKELICGCQDYIHQHNAFGMGACKHVYASLNLMGISSLKEFKKLGLSENGISDRISDRISDSEKIKAFK